jgi:glycosyltransferase involved in cell wall biosynthesis
MGHARATIVIPTRDRQELADRALGAALDQTVRDIEVLVVDDGSRSPYRPGRSDDRITLLRTETSMGPSAARNLALRQAGGEWVSFLDDDDYIIPEMLEISLQTASESSLPKPVSVLSGAEIVSPDGTVLKTRMPPTLPRGGHFFLEDLPDGGSFQTHATLVAPTDLVRSIGGFDEALKASEHDDFFLRLNAVSSIQGVRQVTYRITAHTGPRLSKAVLERAQGMEQTVAKHEPTFRQHPRRFARYLSTMGVTYLRAGEWGPAVRATTRSIRVDPLRADSYRWWLASLAGPVSMRISRSARGSAVET